MLHFAWMRGFHLDFCNIWVTRLQKAIDVGIVGRQPLSPVDIPCPLLSPMRCGEKSLLTRQERDRKIDWEVGDDVDTRTLPCFLLSHNISAIALTTST